MASESQLPYRQVNICASLEMTTKWIPAFAGMTIWAFVALWLKNR